MSTAAQAALDGAMKGYAFVDGIYRRQQRDEDRQEDRALAKEDRERNINYQDADRKTAEAERIRQANRQDALDAQNQTRFKQGNESFDIQKQDKEKVDRGRKAQAALDYLQQGGKPTDEHKKIVNELSTEIDKLNDDGMRFNLSNLSSGVQEYLSGKNKGSINSPKFIKSFNVAFKEKINRNYGAKFRTAVDPDSTIVKKEVNGFMPGKKPGTVVVDLRVTAKTKDGKVFTYTAPATVGRSNDDEVAQIPVEQILGDIATRQHLANDDDARNQLQQQLRGLVIEAGLNVPEKYSELKQLPDGSHYQTDSSGKAHGIRGLGRGRGGSSPADQQMIEYYINVQKLAPKDAIALVNSKDSRSLESLAEDIYLMKLRAAGELTSPEEKAMFLAESKKEAMILKNEEPTQRTGMNVETEQPAPESDKEKAATDIIDDLLK